MSKDNDKKCILCGLYETEIREDEVLCGEGTGDDFMVYYNGRHHYVMTKKLQRDIDNEKKSHEEYEL